MYIRVNYRGLRKRNVKGTYQFTTWVLL